MEEWRPVPSAPHILASSMGRVMLAPYEKKMPWHHGTRKYGGHAHYGVWSNGRFVWCARGKNYKVARLICEAFHGAPPTTRAVCMHLNENARDNRPENLKWGTQRENLNAPGFLAYCRGRTGENNPNVKGRAARAS
jgi:hypothetical protein